VTPLDVLVIAAGVIGLVVFVLLWRRYPRRRVHLVVASLLAAGAAVFVTWWTMFRVDDPTFSADRERAKQTQEALDQAFGDEP
jgi:uncharacterized membrane protein YqjE